MCNSLQPDLGKRYFQAEFIKSRNSFYLSLPASEVYPLWKDEEESIFVQGIIDCVFEDENGLVLVDYKSDGITDRYKGGFEQAKPILEERYRFRLSYIQKPSKKFGSEK